MRTVHSTAVPMGKTIGDIVRDHVSDKAVLPSETSRGIMAGDGETLQERRILTSTRKWAGNNARHYDGLLPAYVDVQTGVELTTRCMWQMHAQTLPMYVHSYADSLFAHNGEHAAAASTSVTSPSSTNQRLHYII